jgi:hypothetical protein
MSDTPTDYPDPDTEVPEEEDPTETAEDEQ